MTTIDLVALDIPSLKLMTDAGVTAIDLMSAGITSLGLLVAALIAARQFYVERYGHELHDLRRAR